MSVNDVWRRIDKHLGVYLDGGFDQIPETAGVYAWFYPLRVTTYDLQELIIQFSKVSEYDALSEGAPKSETVIDFNWVSMGVAVEQRAKLKSVPDRVFKAWEAIVENKKMFESIRKALMSASLLMPPLYVGKTSNLRQRCIQHVNGRDEITSNFHKRFSNYAEEEGFPIKEVKDLIFVCVETATEEESFDNTFMNPHSVVEEILKAVAKPAYGKI